MGWTALCFFAKEEHYENRRRGRFPMKNRGWRGLDSEWNGSLPRRPNLPLPGVIHILRQHNLDFFSPTHQRCQHKYNIERQQNWPLSKPIPRTQSPFYSATSIFAVCRNLVQEIWFEIYGSRNQVREKWP